ncbi:MAG: FAD-binding oxidoreductase [Pseudomonadota bacterium]
MVSHSDIIVIGAGIAGASAAALLAEDASVTLLEQEAHPGFHATGRSAAFYAPFYGTDTVRRVSAASAEFYCKPPDQFSEVELLRPRACLIVGDEGQSQTARELQGSAPGLIALEPAEARRRIPILREDYPAHCLLDDRGGDLDVDAILQAYLRQARHRKGRIVTDSRVTSLESVNGSWRVCCGESRYQAPIIVNAAGAWADELAHAAGLAGLGITPKRRTAVLVEPPQDIDISGWPLAVDMNEAFYFKPDAGLLLLSPADETPTSACDAQPDELDIAIAVDRVLSVTELNVKRVAHAWAGLRSFAPDGEFVLGHDSRSRGFYWLAGQGGYGVQSAPALAELLAEQITGRALSGSFAPLKPLACELTPDRLLELKA